MRVVKEIKTKHERSVLQELGRNCVRPCSLAFTPEPAKQY